MKIAVVCHVRHPIAQPFMGGMEAHSYHLIHGLVARGHDVTAFASGDSAVAAPLVPLIPRHYDADLPWARYHDSERLKAYLEAAFTRAVEEIADGDFDVVHNNTLHALPLTIPRTTGRPTVTSLHVPPFKALKAAVTQHAAPDCRFTVTSQTQARTWWGDTPSPYAAAVHNGIDTQAWATNGAKRNGRAIWTGRITPNKGTHLALEAAHLAGMALDLFGPIEDEAYFAREVAPWLDERRQYHGHADAASLASRYGQASLFVFTPMWDEPFGLAAVEAMASGLPVAATDMGAAREVVGDAGAVAEPTAPALARAMARAIEVAPSTCMARVETQFSLERMLEGYETQYAHAIAGARAAATSAVTMPAPEARPQLVAA